MLEPKDQKEPIETASGTTSDDNSNSGPFAYIITGVTLVVVLLLSLLATACMSFVISTGAASAGSGTGSGGTMTYPGPGTQPHGYDYYNDPDLDELLEQYLGPEYGGGNSGTHQNNGGHSETGTVDIATALDFDLAPYSVTIDSELSASAYAGTNSEVRTFVRDLVTKDREYATRVSQALLDATSEDASRAEYLASAKATCTEARDTLGAMEVPAGDQNDGTTKDALGTAKSEAVHRWELIEAEIDLITKSDKIDTKALWDADDKVVSSTESAADLLADAMSASTDRK